MRWAALCLFGVTACSGQLTATPRDWDAYRRVRTATTVEERLSASQDYLARLPEGRYRNEVSAWYSKSEPRYYAHARKTRSGLLEYLDTLPRGPHAKAAAERLAELDLARKYRERREERLTEEGQALIEKLADADAMRRTVVREVGAWARRLAGIRSFGERTSALPHELIYHFRLESPEGRCQGSRCVKTLGLSYAIPDSGRLRARKAVFDIVLQLDRGGVASAGMTGPELWSRVGEAAGLDAVKPDDALVRVEAIARSVQIVAGAIEPVLPDQRCHVDAVGALVLARQCDGVRLEMLAATEPTQEDRITVAPVAEAHEGE